MSRKLRIRSTAVSLACLLAVSGCATDYSANRPFSEDMPPVEGPPISDVITPFDRAIACLDGQIHQGLTFSVGAILDATGKEQLSEGGTGKFITQGAGDIVQSALFQAGAVVLNRRDPRVMETEARWGVRDTKGVLPSVFFVTGSINSLDFIPGGGFEAQIAGVGPRYRQYRIVVGLDLSLTETRTGRIVANIPLQKQIVASEAGFGVGRFFGDTLVSLDVGNQRREAVSFALRQMLNLATFELLTQLMKPELYAHCSKLISGVHGVADGGRASRRRVLTIPAPSDPLPGTKPVISRARSAPANAPKNVVASPDTKVPPSTIPVRESTSDNVSPPVESKPQGLTTEAVTTLGTGTVGLAPAISTPPKAAPASGLVKSSIEEPDGATPSRAAQLQVVGGVSMATGSQARGPAASVQNLESAEELPTVGLQAEQDVASATASVKPAASLEGPAANPMAETALKLKSGVDHSEEQLPHSTEEPSGATGRGVEMREQAASTSARKATSPLTIDDSTKPLKTDLPSPAEVDSQQLPTSKDQKVTPTTVEAGNVIDTDPQGTKAQPEKISDAPEREKRSPSATSEVSAQPAATIEKYLQSGNRLSDAAFQVAAAPAETGDNQKLTPESTNSPTQFSNGSAAANAQGGSVPVQGADAPSSAVQPLMPPDTVKPLVSETDSVSPVNTVNKTQKLSPNQPAACRYPSGPALTIRPPQASKHGNKVYVESETSSFLCVLDAEGKFWRHRFVTGKGRQFEGAAPWRLQSPDLSKMRIFFQGAELAPVRSQINSIVLREAEFSEAR